MRLRQSVRAQLTYLSSLLLEVLLAGLLALIAAGHVDIIVCRCGRDVEVSLGIEYVR